MNNPSRNNYKVKSNRIAILDGFRTLAILSVLLYHFFYRWNDTTYPYLGGDYFHKGFNGVSFFFIISGFVICYSLENTSNFILFWKKRMIRLFPSMLIASIITFTFLIAFDLENIFPKSHNFRNFLISITFLPPNLFNWFSKIPNHFSYLNYSYWSLWPEIQFYFLVSIVYFFSKVNFIRNFLILSILLIVCYQLILFLNFEEIKYLQKSINLFNIVKYLPFFLSGVLFYAIYKKETPSYLYFILLLFSFLILNINFTKSNLIIYSSMFLLFLWFIYYPKILRILENKIITKIGVSSYFLYLIHEYIGIVIIKKFVNLFYPYSFIAPLLVIILMIVFSMYYTNNIESKISKYLKRIVFKQEK